MKRTAKRDRRSQRKSQKRNTMRRAVRKSQRKSQRKTMGRAVRKSQKRKTMGRKTKRNKRSQHTGGMKGLEKVRQTIGKSYERRRGQRTESKNRMNKVERLKLLGQINALSQSLKLTTDAELDHSGISVLHKALRDLQKKLLDHDTRGITPYDEIQIALGAAGDVAMDSFREGRTALANTAGEQGQAATRAAAVAASEFFRRMNDMWGSLRSTPEIKPQLMIEDRPQPPQ